MAAALSAPSGDTIVLRQSVEQSSALEFPQSGAQVFGNLGAADSNAGASLTIVGAPDADGDTPYPAIVPTVSADPALAKRTFGFKHLDGLPEPATWALFIIGFGMIGSAIRGLIVANRRLAKLRSDDTL